MLQRSRSDALPRIGHIAEELTFNFAKAFHDAHGKVDPDLKLGY
jgi:hypothetical protein